MSRSTRGIRGVATLQAVADSPNVSLAAPVRGVGEPWVEAVAFCPHPPVLVPAVAGRAAAEFAPLLDACLDAVRWLVSRPRPLLILGSAHPAAPLPDFAPGLADPDLPPSDLPLSLAIGVWLVRRCDPGRIPLPLAVDAYGNLLGPVDAYGRPIGPPPDINEPVLLLVMGDGSARRGPKAPGYLDPRAEAFDTAVVGALAAADVAGLAELDVPLAEELLVGGVGPWRAVGRWAADGEWRAELRYASAAAGVQYVVATWERLR